MESANSNTEQYGLQYFVIRALWLLSATAALLLVMSLGLLVYSAWRYVDRIEPIQVHLQYLSRLEAVEGELRAALIDQLEAESNFLEPGDVGILRERLEQLSDSGAGLLATSPDDINYALTHFKDFDGTSRFHLEEALSGIRHAVTHELAAHQSMVAAFSEEAHRAQRIALGLAAALLLVFVLLWLMAQRRIIEPLKNLGYLMKLLARRDYTSAPMANADPLLRPLLDNYNRMVKRLHKLEQAQQQRQENLTDAVRTATHMMLQQQRRLSQAERLGAVGEVAASVAHELRNPLTSVQMALENLRRDLQDGELVERTDLIMGEVRRVTRQLNQLLDQARQRPEKPQHIDIANELEELVTLAAYQLHENVSVRYRSDEDLRCDLPQGRFRQVLLNLILNAGQVLAERGGEIAVDAKRAEECLTITVSDNGPGFHSEILDAGVQAFRSWRIGGTGLGLVMVRRFADDLGGELILRNNDDGGACVVLSLPCRLTDG